MMSDEKFTNKIRATVIKDSRFEGRDVGCSRLITVEYVAPKFLLAEINTHRMMVKNASSSRSEPTTSFMTHVFVPTKVGKNKSGMQSSEYLNDDELSEFQKDWLRIYEMVSEEVCKLKDKYNPHKQTLNRLLEPFILAKGVITATEKWWNHFFMLRDSDLAQPEIKELSVAMRKAINDSTPQTLRVGEWHLPYVDSKVAGDNNINIKISASCVAQVSYRKLDLTEDKALSIFEKLNLLSKDKMNPPHISPVQHIACCVSKRHLFSFLNVVKYNIDSFHSEFGEFFVQCSKLIENLGTLSFNE
ncbi:MAG: hypothetical protein EKK61_05695 [Rickettsiales bacterium]|nr:MAG: hypothetical protein EKK61_05695 [Rickettsiales bacterium]